MEAIYVAWIDLANGEYGTPITLSAIAKVMGITVNSLIVVLENRPRHYCTDYELIPSRNKNYQVGNQKANAIVFYRALVQV